VPRVGAIARFETTTLKPSARPADDARADDDEDGVGLSAAMRSTGRSSSRRA
jgi:hypothetical protein